MAGRALVLGGGGITGIAWEIGLLSGFDDAGIDLGDADLIIGTSAGSVVASLLAGGMSAQERFESQLADPGTEVSARIGAKTMLAYGLTMLRNREPQQYRARIGAMAMAADTGTAEDRRAVIAARLPVRDWPARPVKITAVDAETGEFVVFDRDSGVDLVDAVSASCAVPGVWPPAVVNQRRYIDGGMRSPVNADLADGYGRVVIIAPIPGGAGPIAGAQAQAARLRANGAQVTLISPDRAARAAIGRNVLDAARRAASATAGRAQASAHLPAHHSAWS